MAKTSARNLKDKLAKDTRKKGRPKKIMIIKNLNYQRDLRTIKTQQLPKIHQN